MRMQRRMLRNQARMFIAKIIVILSALFIRISDASQQLGDYAMFVLLLMITIALAEFTYDI